MRECFPAGEGFCLINFREIECLQAVRSNLFIKLTWCKQFSEMIFPPRISGKLSKRCDITVNFDMLAKCQSEKIPTIHLAIYVVIIASESC